MNTRRLILAIEDDRLEAMILKRAFHDAAVANPLEIMSSCQEALAYLLVARKEKPMLILLDLNLPGMNGIECLRALKTHPQLKRIPVIVLTASSQPQDRDQSFELSAAGYLVKPLDYEEFVNLVKVTCLYWLSNDLPD